MLRTQSSCLPRTVPNLGCLAKQTYGKRQVGVLQLEKLRQVERYAPAGLKVNGADYCDCGIHHRYSYMHKRLRRGIMELERDDMSFSVVYPWVLGRVDSQAGGSWGWITAHADACPAFPEPMTLDCKRVISDSKSSVS